MFRRYPGSIITPVVHAKALEVLEGLKPKRKAGRNGGRYSGISLCLSAWESRYSRGKAMHRPCVTCKFRELALLYTSWCSGRYPSLIEEVQRPHVSSIDHMGTLDSPSGAYLGMARLDTVAQSTPPANTWVQ